VRKGTYFAWFCGFFFDWAIAGYRPIYISIDVDWMAVIRDSVGIKIFEREISLC
jgi:hypothetical protein